MKYEKLSWNQADDIGIEEIDKQHQAFIKIANDIFDLAKKTNVTRDELFVDAVKLSEYALAHFETEEKYLSKLSGPDVEMHLEKHEEYRDQIAKFIKHISGDYGEVSLFADMVAKFAHDYVTKHMLAARKESIIYLKKR